MKTISKRCIYKKDIRKIHIDLTFSWNINNTHISIQQYNDDMIMLYIYIYTTQYITYITNITCIKVRKQHVSGLCLWRRKKLIVVPSSCRINVFVELYRSNRFLICKYCSCQHQQCNWKYFHQHHLAKTKAPPVYTLSSWTRYLKKMSTHRWCLIDRWRVALHSISLVLFMFILLHQLPPNTKKLYTSGTRKTVKRKQGIGRNWCWKAWLASVGT